MTTADEPLALASRLSDLLLGLDQRGRVVHAGATVEAALGRTPDEVEGRPFDDLLPADQREEWAAILRKVSASPAAAHRATLPLDHGDGTTRWMDVVVSNELDRSASAMVVVAGRDHTDARTTETALRADLVRLEALSANSTDVLTVLDENGTIVWASGNVENTFGYPVEALMGRPGTQFLQVGDLDVAAERLGALLEEPGGTQTTVWRARHADGSYRWVEAVSVNLLDHPAVRGIATGLRDITERRRTETALRDSEARFRAVVLNSRDATAVLDPKGRLVWASPNVAGMLHLEPDELAGARVLDLVHPDDADDVLSRMTQALLDDAHVDPIALRARQGHDSWLPVEVAGSALRNDEGGVEGIILNIRDIEWRVEAEQALRESEERFRAVVESSPVGIYMADASGRCLYVNDRWQEIAGLDESEAMGHGWVRMIHPDDLEWLLEDVGNSAFVDELDLTYRVLRPDSETRWITVHTSPLAEAEADGPTTVGVVEDITDRVLAEHDTQRLTDIFEATQDLVGIADREGRLLYLNRATRRFFELPVAGGLEDLDLGTVLTPWAREQLAYEIDPALQRDGIWSGDLALTKPDGEEIPVLAQLLVHRDVDGEIEFYSGVVRDISERKAFEHRLAHQATHDALTGLPNRVLLLDKLDRALTRARRYGTSVAVLFIDLDHFKVVNDSLGHSLGDRLLITIAERLAIALRPGDTIARFGGDEFVLLCEDLDSSADATLIARRVEQALSGPFILDESEVYVGVSIGIAFSEDDDHEPETLIRDADAAMYRAKDKGRARYEVFDSHMRAHAVDRLDIENALRRALERRELRVFYQPIADLRLGRITGVEALVRWEHPERGLLRPGEFVTIAEETGLIVPIGGWVLQQACRQLPRWDAEHPGTSELFVTVNLSGRQLGHPRLVDEVQLALDETGMDPARLALEVTESVLMDDVEMSATTLSRLKDLGVRLVVDDFGTGYSSLSYLHRFPVDVMKVDRSFVDGLGTDAGDSAIVTAIVDLAHTLGLGAVAEGVETPAQLEALRQLGCDHAQGFHIARPLSGKALLEFLSDDPRL